MKAGYYLLIILLISVLFYGVFHLVNFPDSLFSPDLASRSSFEIFEHNKLTKPPKTGWFADKEASYYYKKGARLTGWQEIENKWYFFEGEGPMKRGWLKAEDDYYLDSETGLRQEGLVNIAGKDYYFEPGSGRLLKSQWIVLDSKEIYLTSEGRLAKGRVMTSEGEYYFDELTGELVADLSKPFIHLSYDDGPSKYTSELLDVLDEFDVKVSFFFQGVNIGGNEDLVKRAYEEGHSIGSHSYSHPNFTTLTKEEIISQIAKTDNLIESATGKKADWFRSPYGEINDFALDFIGKPVIHWNIDSQDWNDNDAKQIRESILYYAKDGAIVIMHDSYKATIEATRELIPILRKKGYQIVNLETLFKIRGLEAESGKVYYGFEARNE